MGIAMTPATEAIMGSLPKEKAGVGSAMNDVLREVGGTLGVAVLGSLLANKYADGMVGATHGLSASVADASTDSVDAAHAVALQAGNAAPSLISSADQAFVTAMGSTMDVASAVALAGALIALIWLPSRKRTASVTAPIDTAVAASVDPVSYTHLTLPTNREV